MFDFSDVLQVLEDCKVCHRVCYWGDNLPFVQNLEPLVEVSEIFSYLLFFAQNGG